MSLLLLACVNCSCTMQSTCPTNAMTLTDGASSIDQCVCAPGFWGPYSNCTQCPQDHYCPANTSTPILCPDSPLIGGSYSLPGSTALANCSCPLPYWRQDLNCVRCPSSKYIVSGTCVECPSDFFCPGDGIKYPCDVDGIECTTHGVGLQCDPNYFFEPRLHPIPFSGCTALTSKYWATATAIYRAHTNTVVVGSSTAGCGDGLYTHINHLVLWQDKLIVSDVGCLNLYMVVLNPVSRKQMLHGYHIKGMALLNTGFLLVSADDMLFEVNPHTNQEFALAELVNGQGVATVPNSSNAYVCEDKQISIFYNGLLEQFAETQNDTQIVLAPLNQILYVSSNVIFQMSPSKQFYDLLALPGLPRQQLSDPISAAMWNNGHLFVSQAASIVNITMCHICPPFSSTIDQELGIARCKCQLGYYMSNYVCRLCPNGYTCPFAVDPVPCAAGYYCTNNRAFMCPSGTYCPPATGTPVLCPAHRVCLAGSSAPEDYCENGYAGPNCTLCSSGISDGTTCTEASMSIFVWVGVALGAFLVIGIGTYCCIYYCCNYTPKKKLDVLITHTKFY